MSAYGIEAKIPQLIIGRQGEAGVTTLEFDISVWREAYPGIVCTLTMLKASGFVPFPLGGVSQEGDTLTWVVGKDATGIKGAGTIVVRGLVGDIEKRSTVVKVVILAGHSAAGEAPAAVRDWISEAALLKEEIEQAEAGHDAAYGEAEDARNAAYALAEAARYEESGNRFSLAMDNGDGTYTINKSWETLREFSFRALGTDWSTFGYVHIPREQWHNDGTYSVDVLCVTSTNTLVGYAQFAVTAKEAERTIVTRYGTALAAQIAYR